MLVAANAAIITMSNGSMPDEREHIMLVVREAGTV
jgi:hypothetical protein